MVENKLLNSVKSRIVKSKLIEEGNHIIVGLSGGPDSVCLFHILVMLSREIGFTVSAVHVNHKFREGTAEQDQAYVEKLCREMGIEIESSVYDCKLLAREKGMSSEEAGRWARYDAFYKMGKMVMARGQGQTQSLTGVKIALAHNRNDQAETILMRILRGTGTDGLAGMEYIREGESGMYIIRPILDIDRYEIEEYCRENRLSPRYDETNEQAIYTRNKLRLELVPLLQNKYNPNILEALNRLGKIAGEDRDYFQQKVDEVIAGGAILPNGMMFSLEELKGLHISVRMRVIKRVLGMLGLEQGLTTAHMEGINSVLMGERDSAGLDLPGNCGFAISYGQVRFFDSSPEAMGYISKEELKKNLEVSIVSRTEDMKDFRLLGENGKKRYAALDLKKIVKDEDGRSPAELLQIRYRREGDWIRPLGMKGRKKLQDIFVDEKVYREKRDLVPLVCMGSEVIWIVGDDVSGQNTGMKRGRISENYKIGEKTEEILLLVYHVASNHMSSIGL